MKKRGSIQLTVLVQSCGASSRDDILTGRGDTGHHKAGDRDHETERKRERDRDR